MLKKLSYYWRRGIECFRKDGSGALVKKILSKLLKKELPVNYYIWLKKHLPDKKLLNEQRKVRFSYSPKISIIMPWETEIERYLKSSLQKLILQTYENWEVIFLKKKGARTFDRGLQKILKELEGKFCIIEWDELFSLPEILNKAVKSVTGEFVIILRPGDLLESHTLYEVVKFINEQQELDLIYTDEDCISSRGMRFYEPHMKPDFNLDLLRTVNYIGHAVIFKKKLMDRVGQFDSEYSSAWEYDYILRCVDTSKQIGHISKILYHGRIEKRQRIYTCEDGKKALDAHYKRNHLPAKIAYTQYPGLYRTRYLWKEKPLISIIIPNKDHTDDLKRCIESIEKKSTYKNYEYIIVENNSTEEETFRFYKELEASNPKVRMVYWDGPFNYSAINNYGIQYAKGEYYLLLNNDTEIINDDCLEELLGYCMRKDVGIVGARLYYEDDTIQHAGVVVGFGGIAGHCFVQQPRGFTGYCHRIICAQDYSAVTAACMMVRKDVFEAVEGLSTELAVAFNDIDFCMKVRQAGYLVVYNPYAELYHYESKSRGQEDTPEKVARFNREVETFAKRWPEILEKGDPFYNPNLTLDSQDFSLKKL